MRAMRLPLLVLALLTLLPAAARAEVRGGSFEVGGLVGGVVWDRDLGLEPCPWFGGFAGHRFEPLAERLHMGFRAHWEGCIGEQKVTEARIDMILVDVAFTYGVRATDWLLLYGLSGAGFLIADSTPSGGRPFPRTVFQGGGGAAVVLGPYFLLDLSVRLLVFENIQFGGFGGTTGTTASPAFTLSIGAHI